MSQNTPQADRPSAKQLAYLRVLADRSGTTFTYPRTRAQASREIRRLKQRTPLTGAERAIARDAQDTDRQAVLPASAVRDDEIVGYGSTATWA